MKDGIKRIKIQDTDWDKIFAKHLSVKIFVSKYIENS